MINVRRPLEHHSLEQRMAEQIALHTEKIDAEISRLAFINVTSRKFEHQTKQEHASIKALKRPSTCSVPAGKPALKARPQM
jgi:hypothetical protein